jgi:hypothetical protein
MRKICNTSLPVLLFMVSTLFTNCEDSTVDPATQVKAHTFTVTTWYWSTPHHYINLGVPEITSNNLETVGVLVYYSTQSNVWTSVPYTVYETVHDYHMGFRYTPGTVEVNWLYDGPSSGDDPNTYYGVNVKCKVVVVPSSARAAYPGLNWNNYEDVRQQFDLKE